MVQDCDRRLDKRMINYLKQRGMRISIKLGSFFRRKKAGEIEMNHSGKYHWIERIIRRNR